MEKKSKDYWRPLWKGLVVDSERKHFSGMKSSVWLFLYFILKADDRTGFLKKSYEAISKEMGVKKRTVRYWLNNLRNKGYVSIQRRNGFCICVRNWKTFAKSSNPVSAPEKSDIILPLLREVNGKFLPLRGQNFVTSGNRKVEKILYSSEETKEIGRRNRYDINKLNIDINDRPKLSNEFNSLFLTKDGLLAGDLAEGLEDEEGFKFYLSVCRKYPEELLREILSQVRHIPADKIKRSKGALFNYLLKNYENRKNNHCR